MKTMQVFYEGRVQGVGFRWTVKTIAKGFDVTGMVKNLPDGRVELNACGDGDEVDAFLQSIRESSLAGHIIKEDTCSHPGTTPYKGFQIDG